MQIKNIIVKKVGGQLIYLHVNRQLLNFHQEAGDLIVALFSEKSRLGSESLQ